MLSVRHIRSGKTKDWSWGRDRPTGGPLECISKAKNAIRKRLQIDHMAEPG